MCIMWKPWVASRTGNIAKKIFSDFLQKESMNESISNYPREYVGYYGKW